MTQGSMSNWEAEGLSLGSHINTCWINSMNAFDSSVVGRLLSSSKVEANQDSSMSCGALNLADPFAWKNSIDPLPDLANSAWGGDPSNAAMVVSWALSSSMMFVVSMQGKRSSPVAKHHIYIFIHRLKSVMVLKKETEGINQPCNQDSRYPQQCPRPYAKRLQELYIQLVGSSLCRNPFLTVLHQNHTEQACFSGSTSQGAIL